MHIFQKLHPFRLDNSSRFKRVSWFTLATTTFIFFIILSSTTPIWDRFLPVHFSKPYAKAASSAPQHINAPFFSGPVPFNKTAIFWFGNITSTDNYTDVRVGYNSSELYIDLRIVDRYLWYDTNKSAPNLNFGDNASIYLNTVNSGSSSLDQYSYKFQAAVNGY